MPELVNCNAVKMLLQVRVAREKPLLRAAGKQAAAQATAAAAANGTLAGSPTGFGSDSWPVMLGVAAVAGVHHFEKQ
jgi:hypothetical protein